jgi:sugar phosphate isomerase/epimerase
MEKIFFSLFLITTLNCFAQDKATNQKHLLQKYIGHWVNTDSTVDVNGILQPTIKMMVAPKMNGGSLQVEVQQMQNKVYHPILQELISHDALTDQIVAAGQNAAGQCFIGKGFFTDKNNWFMQDQNYKGEPTMQVDFNFINNTEVALKGTIPNATGWNVTYIKQNPKDKNIGIQLVSVKDAMEKDATETITQLGRMGFSFVETFVYNDRKFYGMSPKQFRKLVEDNGMTFKGSMTFKSLPANADWAATMNWWNTCIQDHIDAGVEYITTSNNDIKKITSLKELKKYCDYYNAVGKLCKAKGIIFGFHNHADEFTKIEGITVYDFLLQNTNPSYVSFQTDIYWMKVGGVNPIDYYKKYAGRFFSWHVKEDGELGSSGKINYAELYSYTKLAGLQYNVAEVEKYNFAPIESVEMAWQFLYYSPFVKSWGK